jgi:hypothetical protein
MSYNTISLINILNAQFYKPHYYEGYLEGQKAADVQPKWRTSGTFSQWSKGCLVRLGITRRVFQKVAYVWYFLAYVQCTIPRVQLYYVQSVRPVGDHRTSALKDSSVRSAFQRTSGIKRQERTSANPSVRLVHKSNFSKCHSDRF